MKKEKLEKIYNKSYSFINKFVFLLLPIITCAIFLLICSKNELYPFGNKSIAWCDMNQQVIPLLNTFKDVLEGKQGFIYNLNHAGGMSLFSVYFFFLSSPLSYLVVFVPKSNMINFMNLLMMFKLMIISGTISFYFHKKYKNINLLTNISLSLLYTFSIYVLMYYQNIMWLDIVYLFPLLILSLDYILSKNRPIPYLVLIVSIVLINYYLAFMVICFVILYMGLSIYYRRKEEGIKQKAKSFILTSILGALISCVSIIPSFIQYIESARSSSLFDTVSFSYFLTSFQTTIPLLLGSISVIPFLFNKNLNSDKKIKYILLALLFIPIIIDPINCMWHIGSYQAFPCRFAFIFTFLVLDITASNFDQTKEDKLSLKHLIGLGSSIILVTFLYIFEGKYIEKKIQDLDQYSHSLWGNNTSFEALLRYYAIILILICGIYLLYRFKLLNKKLLSLSLVNFTIVEILFSTSVYLIPPSREYKQQNELYSISEYIDDPDFYRVKTEYKLTDVNAINGAGLSTLGHYTSLTNEDYMFTMKKLGYSSYWMEVGTNGGTSFTDALLINKYTLKQGKSNEAKYYSENYYFQENKVLPFGLITNSDLSKHIELEEDTRVNMQEKVYDVLFNDNSDLHTVYSPLDNKSITITQKGNRTYYSTSGENSLIYLIKINGNQDLYFEAFDQYSNSLKEKINEKIVVTCNEKYYSYPSQSTNGSIYLGSYKDQTVTVKVKLKSSIDVCSFNVFSVNKDLLNEKIDNTTNHNLKVDTNIIKGEVIAKEGDYLFLPISYFKGMKAKINGKKVEVNKVFSTFVAIKLVEGTNNLSITFSQPGLSIGIIISLLGIVLLSLYLILLKKNKIPKILDKISYYSIYVISILTFALLYIFPIIMNILHQVK